MQVGGVYVALLTPLREDRSLDTDALAALVEYLLDQEVNGRGVDGLVALGTTGEFADLRPEERTRVLEVVVATTRGRVPVLAGIAAVGTDEACAHAAAAQATGVDGLLSLPPLFWKLDDDGLFQHFARVIASTELPVLLYDFPALVGTGLSPGLVTRVAREFPRAVGIKQTVTDYAVVHDMIATVKPQRPDFRVMVGFENLTLPALLIGGDGAISGMANFCAPLLTQLTAAVRDGDLHTAADCHRQLLRSFGVYGMSNPPSLALKTVAHALGVPVAPVARTTQPGADAIVERVTAWALEFARTTPDRRPQVGAAAALTSTGR